MRQEEDRPSRTVLAFFRWYCHPCFLEEIEGDLIERFNNYSEKYGSKRAKWLFIKEVLLLFRPSIIGNIFHLINKNATTMTTQHKRLVSILISAGTLLLIPFIAMRFTNDVKWTLLDFLVAGILFFGTGFILEFILRKIKDIRYRIIFSVILFVLLFLIWAELAVGVFGTPFAGS